LKTNQQCQLWEKAEHNQFMSAKTVGPKKADKLHLEK